MRSLKNWEFKDSKQSIVGLGFGICPLSLRLSGIGLLGASMAFTLLSGCRVEMLKTPSGICEKIFLMNFPPFLALSIVWWSKGKNVLLGGFMGGG